MTWNEFKKYVEERLSDEEKKFEIYYIDTGNYPDLKYSSSRIDVFVDRENKNIGIH